MRVLTHIHTYNDADVIEQVLEALRCQTRSPDAIMIVDNASTDGTLDRTFPADVTVIRNLENLGPSGAVGMSFVHALQRGFDWVWVLDADSVPETDALEKLLGFFEGLPLAKQDHVCFLASWPLTEAGDIKQQPIRIERAALELVPLARARDFTQCDCTLWSGALYRMTAVARIGLPTADYVIDMGEVEYGYRARRQGFASYIVHKSMIRHDVGRNPGIIARPYRLGPISLMFHETSPVRAYYATRNPLYFWLYQYRPRQPRRVFRALAKAVLSPIGFVHRPINHRRQLIASLRGLWDGLTAQMERRY